MEKKKNAIGSIGSGGRMGFDWGSHFWHSVFIWATGIAAVFGGIGVIAAFIAGMVGYQVTEFSLDKSRKDQQSANLEIAKAHSKTAELAADAEKSRALIAEANARAAEAAQYAAEAQLALEKFKAPRVLSAEQQSRITQRVRAFPGMQFDAGLIPGDVEAAFLLRAIEDSLLSAGWVQVDWKAEGGQFGLIFNREGRKAVGVSTVANVFIGIHPGSSQDLVTATQVLASALESEGVPALATIDASASGNANALHIRIGKKM